jgi:hypothetical protein
MNDVPQIALDARSYGQVELRRAVKPVECLSNNRVGLRGNCCTGSFETNLIDEGPNALGADPTEPA